MNERMRECNKKKGLERMNWSWEAIVGSIEVIEFVAFVCVYVGLWDAMRNAAHHIYKHQ